MMNLDLFKLKPSIYLVTFMLIIALIVPGHLILFLFKKDIYFALDGFRLILLPICIASPVLILNYLGAVLLRMISGQTTGDSYRDTDVYFQNDIFGAALLTNVALFTSSILGYFSKYGIQELIEIVAYCELALLVGNIFVGIIMKYGNK